MKTSSQRFGLSVSFYGIPKVTIFFIHSFLQNQLFGKGKDTIYDAGARIKRALSPGRNIDPDLFDVSPYGSPTRSPKVPRLSLNPEISDDEDDDDVGNDGDKETASAAVY